MIQDETGQLPEGWRWVRLEKICDLVNGDAYKPTDWSQSGTRIIRIENLNDHSKPFNHWAGSLDRKVKVKTGDVLLAWSGTPGTSFGAHLWERGNAVLNQHIFRVDFTTSEISKEWFVYAVNDSLNILIDKAHGGVGLRHVKKGEVESLEIPIPPFPEQRRIAAILTEHMAAVDKARAGVQAQLDAAKKLPAAYLREVFEGAEEIKRGEQWYRLAIEELTTVVRGSSPRPKGDKRFYGGNVPRLMVADVTRDGMYVTPKIDFLTKVGAKLSRPMKKGEVVMVVSGAPGLPAILAVDTCIHDGFVGFKEIKQNLITNTFFYYYLKYAKEGHDSEATGAIFRNLTTDQIKRFEVPLPSVSDQEAIAKVLDHQINSANSLIGILQARLDKIDNLPAALLRRAFNGEL